MPSFLSYGPWKCEGKKSRKQGYRRCVDPQQKMAELGKWFHLPGRGEFLIQIKWKKHKTLPAASKFCFFMEQVSVRICCGDTEVAVAPRADMCCTQVECELQSQLWIIPSCLLGFCIFLFSAISFYTKAPLPQPCTHPTDDSGCLSYGLGRHTRDTETCLNFYF